MAQKTLGQKPTRAGSAKPHKTTSPMSTQPVRQEYPEVNAAIDKGLADVAAGRVTKMSFAEYAEIVVED